MKFLGIIPARYASTRFPGKPLVDIGGKSMIQRVYEQVSLCLDEVWVATDDLRIKEAVDAFGGRCMMTSDQHKSGTDRCLEVVNKLNTTFDVVINIQGDEPFIQPAQIELLKNCFVQYPQTQIATLVKPFSKTDEWATLSNPNSPKVVLNSFMEALYFSRSVIPYLRNEPKENWLNVHTFYKHIGLYAYLPKTLSEIAALPMSTLEKSESLEQLRWLENGYKIQTAVTNIENLAVDTPEDLALVRQFFMQNNV
jgi:3-deoxy-manno-octulosonate cytidylyltransferase (CMP-KDO synthetase)